MSVPVSGASVQTPLAHFLDRAADWLQSHWLLVVLIGLAIWSGLPWLAPLFMHLGWETPARAIYALYVLFCHQLPQRSWFLFGPEFTYSHEQILMAWTGTIDPVTPLRMRAFVGDPAMGWKIAWTDRMISFYTGWLLVGLLYAGLRKRWRGLGLAAAILLMLPMVIDGGTHMFSDLGGLREGFRESNVWLALLTDHVFAPEFYAGDQWGSFNSIARLLTGLLAAFGLIGFAFPYIDRAIASTSPLVGRRREEANTRGK